jgi:hypothetical protein
VVVDAVPFGRGVGGEEEETVEEPFDHTYSMVVRIVGCEISGSNVSWIWFSDGDGTDEADDGLWDVEKLRSEAIMSSAIALWFMPWVSQSYRARDGMYV